MTKTTKTHPYQKKIWSLSCLSGKILLWDPLVVNSERIHEEKPTWPKPRIYQNAKTWQTLTYKIDFTDYETVIESLWKTMNELLEDTNRSRIESETPKDQKAFSLSWCHNILGKNLYAEFDLPEETKQIVVNTRESNLDYDVYAEFDLQSLEFNWEKIENEIMTKIRINLQ